MENKSNSTITESGIQIINGIELSTSFPRGTLHILGYGIDITNTELNKKMEELKNNTWNHIVSIIEQLKKDYNIFFKYDEIKNLMTKNHTLTTLDIAKLCVKNGYASSIQEAYEKYLIKANKRIRNINKELSYQSCIELISNIGGIPVLANPKALEIPEKEFLVLLKKMINCGLQGIETYHSEYTEEEINENNAFSQIDVARLGLHNDGYLASETDYGTFEIDERDESLLYQHNLTKYTSFGGESTKSESKYNNFENAIEDMKYRHCSYLNKTYDREVKEKWKKSTYYSNTDIYSGQNGYKYIQDHLGYRFVLREVKLKQEGDSQRISMKLENTGFGNIINPKDVEIIYKQGDTTFTSKVETDIRKDLSKEENISNLNYLINLPKGIKPGNYDVYIKISEPYESLKYNTKYNIQFANINIWNENIGANFIGNVTIEENIEADENSQNSSFEKNNNDVLFIQTILKIALIIAILMIILIIIYKIMANKDKKQ